MLLALKPSGWISDPSFLSAPGLPPLIPRHVHCPCSNTFKKFLFLSIKSQNCSYKTSLFTTLFFLVSNLNFVFRFKTLKLEPFWRVGGLRWRTNQKSARCCLAVYGRTQLDGHWYWKGKHEICLCICYSLSEIVQCIGHDCVVQQLLNSVPYFVEFPFRSTLKSIRGC